ncbi:S-adenosyl-L-methionine-dependentmethyltransferases superfamily protein [Striga asiatica]|uniref:S-adenosyl-L-methionine-dependentmethyltransferases superfamily protein n=1 Tax=Striga asiatica TaxID=4170 RepID=A0A5A7RG19_STRAF|nr:S-adenosyl-L-methionine-dependentmethyltransferases superfamily protein [Striga asiatica]
MMMKTMRRYNFVDGSDAYSVFSQYSSRLEGLEQEENGFWYDFVAIVNGTPKDNDNANRANVQSVMDFMKSLGANGGMDEGGDLWCQSICVLRDSVNREMFIKMDYDGSRLS